MTSEDLKLLDEIKNMTDRLEGRVRARLVEAIASRDPKRVMGPATEIGGIVVVRAALDTIG